MKILLTVHQFFPDYFSGTEVLTYSVARELLSRGHAVAVMTGFPARKNLPPHQRLDEYDIDGIHVFRFHHAYIRMHGQEAVTEVEYNNLLAAEFFARIARDFAPDVVHFFHLSRLGTGLIDVVTELGIPSYYTPTDFWAICPTSQLMLPDGAVCKGPSRRGGNCVKHVAELTRGPKVAKLARLVPNVLADAAVALAQAGLLPRSVPSAEMSALARRRSFNLSRLNVLRAIVSPTRFMTNVLTQHGIDAKLIRQSAYGIDTSSFVPLARSKSPDKPLRIGFIGTLAAHKGCLVLIQAFKRLPANAAVLKIYGNPNDFPLYSGELTQAAAGIGGIEFCGTFPNTEVAQVIQGLDVVVVPSLWYENTPLVVYSALASGAPVVASDFPGLSEAVQDGDNGLLFPAGDVQALADRLRLLLDQPTLLRHLSKGCKRPKNTATYVDELLALYMSESGLRTPALKDRQKIKPREFGGDLGYLCGWAVVDYKPPVRVRARQGARSLGETTEFFPRTDVRDGLRNGGASVAHVNFGFHLVFSAVPRREGIVLEIEALDGRIAGLSLDRITCGSSVQLGGGDFVGLDEERLSEAAI